MLLTALIVFFASTGSIMSQNRTIIYPGTKWCGMGDIATNYNDLGTEKETDKCCRSHDKCNDVIPAGQIKYNLKNPSSYSRLNCKCDNAFLKCLKVVNNETSSIIGRLYFDLLRTQCFKYDYPQTGCKRSSQGKCLEYTFDTSKPKRHQWFDVPNFY